MPEKKLYLIDAMAFCYRAFYAIGNLSTSFGQPSNAIYGFIRMLNKILKEKKPQFMAVCFDVSRDTARQKKFADYKMQRPPMPEGLSSQIPLIKEIISAYKIPIFEKAGYEADDIIATLAKKAKAKRISTVIISSDKDILQLVDKDTTVFSPYKDEGVVYDQGKVEKRFGVKPKDIPEVIALMGDDADNIPGVPGIGEKTAVELLKDFGSLQRLLSNLEKIKSEKLREAIKAHLERIKLNQELAVLDRDMDLEVEPGELTVGEPDLQELFRLFKYLEFKALLKELPYEPSRIAPKEVSKLEDNQLEDYISSHDELILSGDRFDELLLSAKDKLFQVVRPGANLKKILANPEIKKLGHDLKKIKVNLGRDNIPLEGLYFDTMVAAYLNNPSQSAYSLNDLAWGYLNKTFAADTLNNQEAVDLIVQLKPILEEELNHKSLKGLFLRIEMPLVEVLSDMELNGIKLDLKILKQLSDDLKKRLIKLVEDIYELSGCQFNINSPKQLREVLFEKLKLPVVKKTKTGPSTDEEVLGRLADKHKLPAILLEYRQLTKLKNTYIDTLPNLVNPKTGRVHTSFNQTGTETGRLSSSNPNLQNIPIKTELGKNIRRSVIAFDEDSYLLSCDYSQIELRILAHISGDPNLISAFKCGEDIHQTTASLIYGVEPRAVTEEMRDTAKRVNFGIVYGLTYYGLSRDLGISNEEAGIFIQAYFLKYPKVQDYMHQQIVRAKKYGFVTTILGRRRYLPEINNQNMMIRQFAERQAINTPIQGSASDLIKLAMIEIHNYLKEKKLKARMILQIHDELLFDVPKEEIKEAMHLIREKMEHVLKLDVPIKVEIKMGSNWLKMQEVK